MRLGKQNLWRIIVFVVAVSIASLLLWYQGILAGLAALAILILEQLPEWRTWVRRRLEARRLHDVSWSISSSCVAAVHSDYPFARKELSPEEIAGCGEEYGFLDSCLPERIAEEAICNSELVNLGMISQRSLTHVVLKRTLDKVIPEARILVEEAVTKFLSSQMSIKSNEVLYTKDGISFLQLTRALGSGPVKSHQHLEKVLCESLDRDTLDELAFSILDPRLLYLITRLGKASSLEELIGRRASGRRVSSFLARRDPSTRTQAGRKQYYLVLKQEYRQGRMDIKKRIDSFPDRITGTGWIYSGGEIKSSYQSISIVPSPVRYANAKQFLAKHFQGMQRLTEEERKRASIVAIPIDVDNASMLPDAPGLILDKSHLNFLGNWFRFFQVGSDDRRVSSRPEFEITMKEILNALSIDFLIKSPTRGEVEFFRRNTSRILKRLELKSLFELHNVAPAALLRTTRDMGFPSYWPEDIEKIAEDDSLPFSKWLDRRLSSLLHEATRTADRISGLLAHPG